MDWSSSTAPRYTAPARGGYFFGLRNFRTNWSEGHRVDLAHELVGIVVVILGGEDQVHRPGRGEGGGRLLHHRDVAVVRVLGERVGGDHVARRLVGVLVRPDHIDVALRSHGLGE